MRVDQRNLTGTAAETGRAAESQPGGRGGRAGTVALGGSGADQVELSGLSRALHASASSWNQRVEQLAAQYQAGQYQPDAAAISRSMIGEALGSSSSELA